MISSLHNHRLLISAAMFAVSAVGLAQPLQVTVIEARVGQLQSTRETSVVIRPERSVEVASGTSGRVLEIFKRQDMAVTQGEVVLRLDTRELELQLQNATLVLNSAQVSLNSAEATNQSQLTQTSLATRSAETDYRNAQQRYEEGKELFSIGAVSRSELDELEATALAAEAALTEAQGLLEATESGSDLELIRLQVKQANNQVAQAQQALEEANITSPLTGDITRLLVEQGSLIVEGTPVFRVASTEQQVATFSVPLPVANRLSDRGNITIPYRGGSYPAQVISTSPLNPTTQLVSVTALLQASINPSIPNGTVTQFSYIYGGDGGIILPRDAVRRELGRRYVFLYQEGVAVRRNVELVGEEGEKVAVLEVPAAAQIIYPIPPALEDGNKVEKAEAP